MRVIFTDNFDYVTTRAKNGTPMASVAYKAGPEPQTVKKEHGEAAIEAGKAKEVKDAVRTSGGDAKVGFSGGPTKSHVATITDGPSDAE